MNVSSPPISGIFPAMLTMFTETGELDGEATQRHADWLISQGVHGLVVTGTSGEFIALTEQERRQVIKLVVQAVGKRVPVYAGTSFFTTQQTIELTNFAEAAGADGILLLPPYYMKPPKPAIIEYFRTVRRNSGLPIMYYNNPNYAGTVELNSWEIATLVADGVFQSTKNTFESPSGIHDLRYLCPESFRVFHGGFRTALEGLAAGAHGWVSGFLNAMPARAVELYQATCVDFDLKQAQTIWRDLIPFTHLFYAPNGLGAVNDLAIWRAFLEMTGLHGGYSRPPFTPLDARQRSQLADLLRQQGLLKKEMV
ncbi:MAG: dihydrodipicolinate synthase family protein [Anaerolineae bacterium]|nr:dihydrodipicolinate synthase family protein [Anaerolineae bacterium]